MTPRPRATESGPDSTEPPTRPTADAEASQSGRPRDERDDVIERSGPQHPPADSLAETPSRDDIHPADRETM